MFNQQGTAQQPQITSNLNSTVSSAFNQRHLQHGFVPPPTSTFNTNATGTAMPTTPSLFPSTPSLKDMNNDLKYTQTENPLQQLMNSQLHQSSVPTPQLRRDQSNSSHSFAPSYSYMSRGSSQSSIRSTPQLFPSQPTSISESLNSTGNQHSPSPQSSFDFQSPSFPSFPSQSSHTPSFPSFPSQPSHTPSFPAFPAPPSQSPTLSSINTFQNVQSPETDPDNTHAHEHEHDEHDSVSEDSEDSEEDKEIMDELENELNKLTASTNMPLSDNMKMQHALSEYKKLGSMIKDNLQHTEEEIEECKKQINEHKQFILNYFNIYFNEAQERLNEKKRKRFEKKLATREEKLKKREENRLKKQQKREDIRKKNEMRKKK